MLTVLVPGGSGQLGRALSDLASPDLEVTAPSSAELDITDADTVTAAIEKLARHAAATGRMPLVINAGAYTAVDAAQTDEGRAHSVNATGPKTLAAACSTQNIPFLHVSTDYVFGGLSERPYEPDDPRGPRNAYGRTKAIGEDAVLNICERGWVVRTSWLYGAHGSNFVKTMARVAGERDSLSVVADQHGSPTWTADLAAALIDLGRAVTAERAPARRVLHCTNAGETTWYGFARAVFEELELDTSRVKPCTTAEFPRPAPRPAYSVLSSQAWRAAGLAPMRPWREALHDFFVHSRAALDDSRLEPMEI